MSRTIDCHRVIETGDTHELDVARELAALQPMAVKQLRAKYAEIYGEETNAHKKAWLAKGML